MGGLWNDWRSFLISWNIRTEDIAAIAQLGERQTEDLKVPGSIPGLGTFASGRAIHPRIATGSSAKCSAAGTRTRVARVKAEYPNQLDYSGYDTDNVQDL